VDCHPSDGLVVALSMPGSARIRADGKSLRTRAAWDVAPYRLGPLGLVVDSATAHGLWMSAQTAASFVEPAQPWSAISAFA
jgi:hypothetical protein